LYLPPDEENFEKHGISNLVVKFNENEPAMELDRNVHKDSPFFKKKMLDGVLDKFVEEINEHCEPIRDEIINLEQLSFLFLGIGFPGTVFVGLMIWYMISTIAFIILMVIYLIVLGFVYHRNYRKT
jgi:hypothetical protein